MRSRFSLHLSCSRSDERSLLELIKLLPHVLFLSRQSLLLISSTRMKNSTYARTRWKVNRASKGSDSKHANTHLLRFRKLMIRMLLVARINERLLHHKCVLDRFSIFLRAWCTSRVSLVRRDSWHIAYACLFLYDWLRTLGLLRGYGISLLLQETFIIDLQQKVYFAFDSSECMQ